MLQRVVPCRWVEAHVQSTFVLFPVGTVYHGTPETRVSWQGATNLCSHKDKKRQSEHDIHPLAEAEGLSGGETVSAAAPCWCTRRSAACSPGDSPTAQPKAVANRYVGRSVHHAAGQDNGRANSRPVLARLWRLLAQILEGCMAGAAVILGGGELRAEQCQPLGLARLAEGAGRWRRVRSRVGGRDALGQVAGCVVMCHRQPQTSACDSAAGMAFWAHSRYAVASQRCQGSGSVDSQPFPEGRRRMGSARPAASSVGATFARKRPRSSSGGASSTPAADSGPAPKA